MTFTQPTHKLDFMDIKLKHLLFIEEYAKGRTAGEAARLAGLGKTVASSKSMASRLMKLPEIQTRIEVERKKYRLAPRRAEFVRAYAGGATSSEAAVIAGYPENKAGSQGARILNDPKVVATMKQKMDVAGVSDDLCIDKILDGLNANKPVVVGGEVVDYPDHQARAVYLDKALRLRGHLVDRKDESGPVVIRIQNFVKNDMPPMGESSVVDTTAKEINLDFKR